MGYTVPTTENHKLNPTVELSVMNCCVCAGSYALNERFRQARQEDGRSWRCPYCGSSMSYCESKVDALKKELELERKRKEWAEQDARTQRSNLINVSNQLKAQKGAKTRLKKRIANGVCPCCTRSFENLQRHMKTKHPTFVAPEG